MMKPSKNVLIFAVIFIILILITNFITYSLITRIYDQEIDNIYSNLVSTRDSVIQEIESERSQRLILENKTAGTFIELEDLLKKETTRVEGRIGEVFQEVEGLQAVVSELDVESSDFSSIIEDVIKAVVSIRTDTGQGSGVFFRSDGYIITNKHVVEDASAIDVIDYDSRRYSVSAIGLARDIDLAILKVEGTGFEYLEFADSSRIRVGERVIAVGNPLGLSFTVTEGIISAVDRRIRSVDYIQTDVPINPGNSGGPLVNARKEIVGINTFIVANTQGLGFAIPSDTVAEFADQALSSQN